MQRSFWTRSLTFVLWLLAGGSVVYWGLKFVQGPAAPATASLATGSVAAVDTQALAKGLGGGHLVAPISGATNADSVTVSSINSSRFVLTGVVVSRAGDSRSSVALIGVDGKPARPYRVGASLADGVVLHSVAAGKAMLAANVQTDPSSTLELPKLTSAVVGTAVAARPALPALGAAPSQVPSAMSALGSRPLRLGANRQREAGKEDRAAKQESPAPAAQN
jgi:general secretion pathway protein C